MSLLKGKSFLLYVSVSDTVLTSSSPDDQSSPGFRRLFLKSLLSGERNPLVPLDFELGRSHSDNQRTIWLCCEADTEPTAITFTFTLHYCIFIHRAVSRQGLSGMIDGANAFYLRDGWRSRINSILQPFHFEQREQLNAKTTVSAKKWRRNIIFCLPLIE